MKLYGVLRYSMYWRDTILRPTTQVPVVEISEDLAYASLMPHVPGLRHMRDVEFLQWVGLYKYYKYILTLFYVKYGFPWNLAKDMAAIAIKQKLAYIGLASLVILGAISVGLLVWTIAAAAERQYWSGRPEQVTYFIRYQERLWLAKFMGIDLNDNAHFLMTDFFGEKLFVERRAPQRWAPWEDWWYFGETLTRLHWWWGMWRYEAIENMDVNFIGLMNRRSPFVYVLQHQYLGYLYDWFERMGLI